VTGHWGKPCALKDQIYQYAFGLMTARQKLGGRLIDLFGNR